jgi:hypothetical protein
MVSVDHFLQGLLEQMGRAAYGGRRPDQLGRIVPLAPRLSRLDPRGAFMLRRHAG